MKCKICGHQESLEIDFSFQLMPTRSNRPDFHEFRNYICGGCKVVFMEPQPPEALLVNFYNTAYRTSWYALNLNGRKVDTIVDFDRTIQGFQRFKNFHDIIEVSSRIDPSIVPKPGDVIMDVGGYQGAFLSGAVQVWGCEGMVYDYNQKGVEFSKRAFGFSKSTVVKDIDLDAPLEKVRFVTSNHSFEHLRDPIKFLKYLKNDVLRPDGFFYLEVPNVFGSHLSDPTHFYMYSEASLKYTLEAAGFEVITLNYSGYPREELLIGHSKENLICVARPRQEDIIPKFPSQTSKEFYDELKASYKKLSKGMLSKVFKDWMRSSSSLLNHFVIVNLVDKLSYERGERLLSWLSKVKKRFLFRG